MSMDIEERNAQFMLPKDYLTKQLKDRDWPFDTPWIMAEFRKCGWWKRVRIICKLICKDCDRLVDTDDDCDCYVEVGNGRRLAEFICLCEPCRERRQQQEEEAQGQSDPDPDAQREAKRDNADWDRQCGWDKEPTERS